MAYKTYICAVLFAFTTGCNNNKDSDSKFISIEEFEQKVVDSVGEKAINCGKVDIGDSIFVVNTCVSDSFFINTPFYAIYIRQGTDSSVASALAMNSSGVVEHWSYDSDISGGSNRESRVISTVCENPNIALYLNDINIDIIECTN